MASPGVCRLDGTPAMSSPFRRTYAIRKASTTSGLSRASRPSECDRPAQPGEYGQAAWHQPSRSQLSSPRRRDAAAHAGRLTYGAADTRGLPCTSARSSAPCTRFCSTGSKPARVATSSAARNSVVASSYRPSAKSASPRMRRALNTAGPSSPTDSRKTGGEEDGAGRLSPAESTRECSSIVSVGPSSRRFLQTPMTRQLRAPECRERRA